MHRDKDGFHFFTCRVDNVLNVEGHRIGTAEIESFLVAHPAVAQAVVVGKPHPVKGEAITGFVMLAVHQEESPELIAELRTQVRLQIGPFASPDILWVVSSLPMTRSGDIMRRILRQIIAGETDSLGCTSTLADASILGRLIDEVNSTVVAIEIWKTVVFSILQHI
jgi:acetyl-CoA synthetase